MKSNSEYGSYDGNGGNYARGRSRRTGRYISRDGGSEHDSRYREDMERRY